MGAIQLLLSVFQQLCITIILYIFNIFNKIYKKICCKLVFWHFYCYLK
jgi:hypothetical protein